MRLTKHAKSPRYRRFGHAVVNRTRHLRRDERGFWAASVGLGFMALFAATTLAVDVGMYMTARSQAQNAADAGALSGATALVFNSFTNRTKTGPAVVSAVSTAQANAVIGETPSVTPADVTFPVDPATGQSNRIRVDVYRNDARGNPLNTMIGWAFGVDVASVRANATAAVYPANAAICVLPLTIPDKWTEKNCGSPTCKWSETDTFEAYDKKGKALPNPDVYVPPGKAGYTGYSAVTDKGLQLTLKTNNGSKISPSMYNPWDLPGSIGGNDYRDNIAKCNSNLVKMGDMMTPENGNMTGPTQQGTMDLKATDPKARWDESCKCVKDSAFAISPRIRIVPLYDPQVYADGQQSGKNGPQLQVVNYLGFFIEDVTGGGEVKGRITPALGKISADGLPIASGGFASVIMLVQ